VSTNSTSFRYPVDVDGKAHPDVVEALKYHDDAITDLQQSISYLKGKSTSTSTSTSSTGAVTGASETVIIENGGTSTQSIGAVNNQAGVTAYTTVPSDYGSEILLNDASAIAVTLSSLTSNPGLKLPWFTTINNIGIGTATLTPTSGTINGNSSLSLPGGTFTTIYFDGTNFTAEIPAVSGSGVTQIIAGTNISLSPAGGTGVVTVSAPGGAGYSLGGTPTTANITLGAGAGTGATISVTGFDGAHQITLNTGTGCVATSQVWFLTFTATRSGGAVIIQPGTGTTYGNFSSLSQIPQANVSTTEYGVIAGAVPLNDSTTYRFYISCP